MPIVMVNYLMANQDLYSSKCVAKNNSWNFLGVTINEIISWAHCAYLYC